MSALYEIYQCNQQPKPLYYYLGYLIEDCPKMRYKAEYQPAEILDMIHTRHWKPFDEMIQVIKDYPIKRQPENQLLEVADDDVMLPIMTEDNVIVRMHEIHSCSFICSVYMYPCRQKLNYQNYLQYSIQGYLKNL